MDGIVFSQAELLTLMDATQPATLVGVDENKLLPSDPNTHQTLVLEGLQRLAQRGLLTKQDGINVLEADLFLMAMTVAHPQLITQIVRYESDGVERKFLYYQTDQVIIEHTMPSATQYRFAAIPNTSAFIQRISFIVSESGSAFPHDPVYQIQVTQDHFLRIKKLVEAGQTTQALEELLVQGASNDSARAFVSAMERPLTNSTVAFMRSEDERIVDGREIVFLRSYTSAWVIYQKKPGDSNLLVETVSMMNLEEKVLDRFLSLVQPVEDVE